MNNIHYVLILVLMEDTLRGIDVFVIKLLIES